MLETKFGKIASWAVGMGSLALVLMVILVSLEIFVRKIFKGSIYISVEYTGYLLAVMMVLGLASVTKDKKHLTVDFLVTRFPPSWQRGIDLAFSLGLFLVYNMVLTIIFLRLFYQSLTLGSYSPTIANTPLWVPQVIFAFGCFLMDLQLVANIISWFCEGAKRSL